MKRLLPILIAAVLSMSAASAQPDPAEMEFAVRNFERCWSQARSCEQEDKMEAFQQLRRHFQGHPWKIVWEKGKETDPAVLLSLLTPEGTFCDMDPTEEEWRKSDLYHSFFHNTPDDKVGIFIADAIRRVYLIAEERRARGTGEELPPEALKAIIHYGTIELNRSNTKPRFHASCFAIPIASSNLYFSMLEDMDRAESGHAEEWSEEYLALMQEASTMLKTLALQSWTQPLRRDSTDQNFVSLERFRNHVWWVGGNALSYRPVLQTAVMFRSVPMVDLLAEICRKCLSNTSQVTYHDAFWTEGFTADGAGWGHGKQCLVWGYPIDGASSALTMLDMLKGTAWEQPLTEENTEALMNFFRGASWYWCNGWRLPGLDRTSYHFPKERKSIAYKKMLDMVLEGWSSSFSPEEVRELEQLSAEAERQHIVMEGTSAGLYTGSRWFFNNDDFMKKTSGCHVDVNMASYRCDGLESATQNDGYNFTCTDGATLLQRDGDEYLKIMGAWDVTAYPGVTAREGMDRLTPVINWRGYCSRYNFAAAAHDSKGSGVAGLIFRKMEGNEKKEGYVLERDSSGRPLLNPVLYGVEAFKSWFFLKDCMVALGAGIRNDDPGQPGIIRTTVEQTSWDHEVWLNVRGRKTVLMPGKTRICGSDSPVWICQKGKFSYSLIPGESPEGFVALERKDTDWMKMNPMNRDQLELLPDKADILRIWTEHGQAPENAAYGYVVWLGEKELPARMLKEFPFEVLRNDRLVQAIRAKDGSVLQAVFYPAEPERVEMKDFSGTEERLEQPGTEERLGTDSLLNGKTRITVSSPCTLMIDFKDRMIYVTDATMNARLQRITVTAGRRSWDITLPQGKYCGDTASCPMDR